MGSWGPGSETTSWGSLGLSRPICPGQSLSEMVAEVPSSPSLLRGAAQGLAPGSGVWGGREGAGLACPLRIWPVGSHTHSGQADPARPREAGPAQF